MNSFAQRTVSAHLDDAFIPSPASSDQLRPTRIESSQDARRRALTALTIHLAFYATAAISLAKALTAPELAPATVWSMGTTYLTLALAHWTLRNGHVLWAARLLNYPLLLLLGFELYHAGGLRSGAAVFLAPLLLFSGATLGRQGLTFCSAWGLSLCALVAVLDHHGLLPPAIPPPTYVAWLQLFIAAGLSIVIFYSMLSELHAAQAGAAEAVQRQEATQLRYFEAQKLESLARLATGVAHDFNNLLGVIANVNASLRSQVPPQPGRHELLDDLDAATTRARTMTGQLLALHRQRATKTEAIDLEEFVRSLVPLLRRLLGDDVEVRCIGSTEHLTVEAHPGQLQQVMLNLVVNARDAMPQGGRLTIRLGPLDDEHVWVSVEDTGVGIADDVRDKIFSDFFTTKETGTGLGLPTVAQIVANLRGTVEVQSNPGRGACFKITLPASGKRPSTAPDSLSRLRMDRSTARILLAEDHELMRRATQRMLGQAGYAVTSVSHGHEALALIQKGARFDVLLTDVSMPGLSGYELAEKLCQSNQGLPTVFLSGTGAQLSTWPNHATIATRYLAKPFAQQDLLDAIEECVAQESSLQRQS